MLKFNNLLCRASTNSHSPKRSKELLECTVRLVIMVQSSLCILTYEEYFSMFMRGEVAFQLKEPIEMRIVGRSDAAVSKDMAHNAIPFEVCFHSRHIELLIVQMAPK